MLVDARNLHFKALNEQIRNAGSTCTVQGCIGQRFIAAGMSGKNIIINGVPGNALGAYLGGGSITVNGNAQDAVAKLLFTVILATQPVTLCAAG